MLGFPNIVIQGAVLCQGQESKEILSLWIGLQKEGSFWNDLCPEPQINLSPCPGMRRIVDRF